MEMHYPKMILDIQFICQLNLKIVAAKFGTNKAFKTLRMVLQPVAVFLQYKSHLV